MQEWNYLRWIHQDKKVDGIQSPPIALMGVKLEGKQVLAILEEQYANSLHVAISDNPSLFEDGSNVFKAFKPIFEGLAHVTGDKSIIHRDITLRNILMKRNGQEIQLDLADWGSAIDISKEQRDLSKELEEFLTKWRKKKIRNDESKSLEPIVIKGSPEQILACSRYIWQSRDVLKLGKALLKTLSTTIKADAASSEGNVLFSLRTGFKQDNIIDTVVNLIKDMCNDEDEPNEIEGIALSFPKRPPIHACLEKLNEIIKEY